MTNKESLNKLYIFFSVFIAVFDKQAVSAVVLVVFQDQYPCAMTMAIAMERYQSYFRKPKISLLENNKVQ